MDFDNANLHIGNKIEFSHLNAFIGSLPKCVLKYDQIWTICL